MQGIVERLAHSSELSSPPHIHIVGPDNVHESIALEAHLHQVGTRVSYVVSSSGTYIGDSAAPLVPFSEMIKQYQGDPERKGLVETLQRNMSTKQRPHRFADVESVSRFGGTAPPISIVLCLTADVFETVAEYFDTFVWAERPAQIPWSCQVATTSGRRRAIYFFHIDIDLHSSRLMPLYEALLEAIFAAPAAGALWETELQASVANFSSLRGVETQFALHLQ